MNETTKRYYDRYAQQISWSDLTHSVHCEMTTALLFQEFSKIPQHPASKGYTPPAEALIALMVDITALGLALMLNEPDTIKADAEMAEQDPDPRDIIIE